MEKDVSLQIVYFVNIGKGKSKHWKSEHQNIEVGHKFLL